MSIPANGVSEAAVESPPITPAAMAERRPLYWSLRRELWENRFLFIAPLIVTAVVLLASFAGIASAPYRMQKLAAGDLATQETLLAKPMGVAPAPIMLVTIIIGVFYSLDALYGERRDRSILFWKSMPLSDRTTVLSKAAVPLVVLPLIALVLSIATQLILLPLTAAIVLAKGLSTAALWLRFLEGLPIMAYGLAVHALWYAPIYGYLMLVSALARRAPLVWAVLPLLAVSALERITFNTRAFMSMLHYRVGGAMKEAFALQPGNDGNVHRLSQLEPLRFLSTPGLWIGLAFAAACFAAAVRLRRYREPI